jgi:hypothetical protein
MVWESGQDQPDQAVQNQLPTFRQSQVRSAALDEPRVTFHSALRTWWGVGVPSNDWQDAHWSHEFRPHRRVRGWEAEVAVGQIFGPSHRRSIRQGISGTNGFRLAIEANALIPAEGVAGDVTRQRSPETTREEQVLCQGRIGVGEVIDVNPCGAIHPSGFEPLTCGSVGDRSLLPNNRLTPSLDATCAGRRDISRPSRTATDSNGFAPIGTGSLPNSASASSRLVRLREGPRLPLT